MSSAKVTETDEILKKKPIMIFGTDVRKIKCFRSSFIYGIYGGFAGGLVCFLATSRVNLSVNAAFASLWLTVFGYWFPCRYKYESQLMKVENWKELRKNVSAGSEESDESE